MLKVLVKAIGTDLFLKVIRIDLEIADESRTESFVRFIPFDDAKKPTPDELNDLVGQTKHRAVQTFRKKQLLELAQSIEDCHMGVASCECDCEDQCMDGKTTAEAPTEPVAAPTPVVESVATDPDAKVEPTKVAPLVEAPKPVEAKKPAPAKKAPAKKEEPKPVEAKPVETPITPEVVAVPAVDTAIVEAEAPAEVVLDLSNKAMLAIVSNKIAALYGAEWNKDRTSVGYQTVIAHLKSFHTKPFFVKGGQDVAPAIFASFVKILDTHFTQAETVSV
jgi:hypothetical protein